MSRNTRWNRWIWGEKPQAHHINCIVQQILTKQHTMRRQCTMQETQTSLVTNHFIWQSISHTVILHCFSAPGQMQQEVQHQIATSPCVTPWWATAAQHFGGARLRWRLHHKTFLKGQKEGEQWRLRSIQIWIYRIELVSNFTMPEFPGHFFEKMSRFECCHGFFGGFSNDIRRSFCLG